MTQRFKNCVVDPRMVNYADSQTLILVSGEKLQGPYGFYDDVMAALSPSERPARRISSELPVGE